MKRNEIRQNPKDRKAYLDNQKHDRDWTRAHVKHENGKDAVVTAYLTGRNPGAKETIPWKASIREYADYRFFKTETSETPSGPVSR